jgi:hypothetical protein
MKHLIGNLGNPDQPLATLIGGVETLLCIDLYTDLLHSMFSQGN